MNWFDVTLVVSSITCLLSQVGVGLCILSLNKRERVWKEVLGSLFLWLAVVTGLIYMSQVIILAIEMVSKG